MREQGGGRPSRHRRGGDPAPDRSAALSPPGAAPDPGTAPDPGAPPDRSDPTAGPAVHGGQRGAVPARRELAAAVALCLLASSAALVAVGRTWVTGTVAAVPPLPAQDLAVTGAAAGSPVRGLAVVGLAGVVAVLAARGWGRTAVGLLLLLAGAGIAAAGLAFDPSGALDAAGRQVAAEGTLWPLAAAAGGGALAVAGALVALRGRRWSSLSQRYDSPAAPRPATPAAPGERELWEALDRGEDPTTRTAPTTPAGSGPPPPPAHDPGGAPPSGPAPRPAG